MVDEFVKFHYRGIFDKLYEGRDDAKHPLRVAKQARTDAEYAVALFHDAIEDGIASAGDLRRAGVPAIVVRDVLKLSRDKGRQTYAEYIEHIAEHGSDTAVAVKLYDLFDHLRPKRLGNLSDGTVKRYTKAIRTLALTRCAPNVEKKIA